MGCANEVQTNPRHGMPLPETEFIVRRFDRPPSSADALNLRHRRVGQAATGERRYSSPRAIIAQRIRAILLASATAATLRGRRSSNCNSQADADGLPGLAPRITAIAPSTSSWRGSVRSQGSLPRVPPADRFSGPRFEHQECHHELPTLPFVVDYRA
jgi:hypothetical protein